MMLLNSVDFDLNTEMVPCNDLRKITFLKSLLNFFSQLFGVSLIWQVHACCWKCILKRITSDKNWPFSIALITQGHIKGIITPSCSPYDVTCELRDRTHQCHGSILVPEIFLFTFLHKHTINMFYSVNMF